MDELAHTNAPGLRHAKRWQDVEDLLAAGINVYTTLNVQHLESLNDIVAQITGVRVRETVPDTIFDEADSVELVDLPPQELVERLREGKVYVPAQAERAMESFFKRPTLGPCGRSPSGAPPTACTSMWKPPASPRRTCGPGRPRRRCWSA